MPEWSPLSGLAVVEVGEAMPLSLCGKLLADAGANVTHVELAGAATEKRASTETRRFGDLGKVRVQLDLDRAADREALDDLLTGAGLFLTSLRHVEAARWQCDCDAVLARHPALVAACVTPWGQSGPYAAFLADDAMVSALAGLADSTPGFPDRCPRADPPVQSSAPLAETGGGLLAAVAVFGALMPSLQGRRGPRHVEIAVLEAVVAQMAYEWGNTAYGGGVAARHTTHNPLEPNVYLPCRDGWVVVVAFSDRHWRGLVDMMGSPAWASEPEYATGSLRGDNYRSLHAHLGSWTAEQHGRDILAAAQQRGLPCACALTLEETLHSEHVERLECLTEQDGLMFPADPIVINGRRRVRMQQGRSPRRPGEERPGDGAGHAARPLAGIRVLDVSQIVSGPYCGQVLASLGADVVLVESDTHLVSRGFGPFVGSPAHDASAIFNQVNRGKRSVQLNLKSAADRDTFFRLAATADVVLENFSRRAADELDITYEVLRAVRDDIVLASISGFGRTGPWGDYVALHSGVILLSGLASVTRDASGNMRLAGAIYPDLLTGTYMALAIMQALAARASTGAGCHLEVSMLEVMLTCMADLVPAAAGGQEVPPSAIRFLPCGESERFIAVSDGHVSPGEIAGLTRSEAMERLQAQGVKAAAVLDISEVMVDPHLSANGFLGRDDHPVAGARPIPAVPWRYDGQRPPLRHAPCLGEHTEEVLGAVIAAADGAPTAALDAGGVA